MELKGSAGVGCFGAASSLFAEDAADMDYIYTSMTQLTTTHQEKEKKKTFTSFPSSSDRPMGCKVGLIMIH